MENQEKKNPIKLPAEVSAKYDLVNPIKMLIIQKPKVKKIRIENCSLEDAKILAEKGFLKEKKSTSTK